MPALTQPPNGLRMHLHAATQNGVDYYWFTFVDGDCVVYSQRKFMTRSDAMRWADREHYTVPVVDCTVFA